MDPKYMDRAAELLRREFGDDWKSVAQMLGTQDLRTRVGKELTSFVAYPERGDGGSNKWRGNCSPEVVRALLRYVLDYRRFYRLSTDHFTVLDPMSGSGTTKDAADSLGVESILYDLNPSAPSGRGGWNALRDDVSDSADLIFLHPPYHSIIQYSGRVWGERPHADDLSRCEDYNDFIEKLNLVLKKLFLALRKDGRLAVLVGDIRTQGRFYSIQRDMARLGEMEAFVVKSQFNCVSDGRVYKKPFIPIVTEYMLIYQKKDALLVPFTILREGTADLGKTDSTALTWFHLVRMTVESVGGRAQLSHLYDLLETHPKARNNDHFRDRIRATLYEHPDQFICEGGGWCRLSYQVA